MEVRKIQNSASGSFFVTLPKTWVKEMDIKKGEELMMSRDEEGALKINPIKNQKKYYHQFVIQIEDYPEDTSLVRCINSSYIQGSDVISVLSKNTITLDRKNLIKNTTSSLIGTEITEEFSNRITIRILVDPLKFPLYNLIKRIYILVNSMHLDAIKSFQYSDEDLAKDVINRGKEVDKLFYLMLRQLNLSLSNRLDFNDICMSNTKIDCVLGIILARDLSKMAKYAVEISQHSIKLKDKQIKEEIKDHLTNMSHIIIKMQQNAILAFFKNDFLRADKVINNIKEVIEFDHKTENEVLKDIKDINTIISLISISRNLRNIANSAVDVSQDLQGKHRPKVTLVKEMGSENLFETHLQLGIP